MREGILLFVRLLAARRGGHCEGKHVPMRNVPRKIGRMMSLRHHGCLAAETLCGTTAMLSMQMLMRERREQEASLHLMLARWRCSSIRDAPWQQGREPEATTTEKEWEPGNITQRAPKKPTMAKLMARERSRSQARRA